MTQNQSAKEILFIGTYSVRGSKGIYVFDFDRTNGTVQLRQTVDNPKSPSFLAIHSSGQYLYAVNEQDEQGEERSGTVNAYAIDPQSGELTFINQQLSHGQAPCHVSLDQSGTLAFVANYGSGSLTVLPIQPDGSLSEATQTIWHTGSSVDPERQTSPHVHSAIVSRDGRLLYVSDLGTDKIHVYEIDHEQGKLRPHKTPYIVASAGSGPRMVAVHPNDQFAYGIKEMSSTVVVFQRDPSTNAFELLEHDAPFLPTGYTGKRSGGDIHVDATGQNLYATNRGNNTLAVFSIRDDGRLVPVNLHETGGDQPRNFLVDEQGEYVLVGHQETDNITVFKRDATTGDLTRTDQGINIPAPVCLLMLRLQ